MTKFSILLLVDESKESQEAIKKLTSPYIKLKVLPGSEGKLPCAKLGNDIYYGLSEINIVAEAVAETMEE